MPAKTESQARSAVDPLNRRQRLFVSAYLAGETMGNATQSAMVAGYSASCAASTGCELLKHPKVAAEIQRETQELRVAVSEVLDQFTLERTKVLRQVAIGAFNDPRGFYDEQGELIPIHKLSAEQAALIEGIETTPVYEGSGRDRVFVGNKITYKLAKRATYVDMAMRHLGEYKRDNEQAGKALVGSLAELVAGAKGSTLPIGRGSSVNVDSPQGVNVDRPGLQMVERLP